MSASGSPLVLASASPRRAELLRAAGFSFIVRAADVDESLLGGEPLEGYVRRVAEAKADAVAPLEPGAAILGADTVVWLGDRMLGKPASDAEAARMLHQLAGRTHEVVTGVCLLHGRPGVRRTRVARTRVEFAPMSADEIDWYVATGEPRDKAGAYAIQGLGSRFVTRIEGSYSNVVGLPVSMVYDLCKEAGILVS